jgi:hypothetical protein
MRNKKLEMINLPAGRQVKKSLLKNGFTIND